MTTNEMSARVYPLTAKEAYNAGFQDAQGKRMVNENHIITARTEVHDAYWRGTTEGAAARNRK